MGGPRRSRARRRGLATDTIVLLAALALTAAVFYPRAGRADLASGMRAAALHHWKSALPQFLPLARAGDRHAQSLVATMYRLGLGVPRDLHRSAHWYALAAAQGYPLAQYDLAVQYREGLGVARDQARATALFREAARQGFTPAEINLGLRIARGIGTRKDRVLGYAWLYKANLAGNALALPRMRALAARMSAAQIRRARALSDGL